MTVLEVSDLCHTFADGTEALKHVNLALYDGELAVIAGPNGSGKSVLARHLIGLMKPTSGSISYPQDAEYDSSRIAAGLVFQDADSQIVGQTVYQDVAFGPENLGLGDDTVQRRVYGALHKVGLEGYDSQRPHNLSGGEKRRLAIAGVIAMDPHVLILDEPFSGLDYPGTRMVLQTIVDLHGAGHTTVVITHDIQKILAHADRLIVMVEGSIAAVDTPERLVHSLERYGLRGPATDDNERAVEQMTWLK